jgi:tRNA (guanosine-2'-O-)-methyltransferase
VYLPSVSAKSPIPPGTSPDDVLEALSPQLTEERKARIDDVLARRLASLTVVLENLHDPHNGAAALRSVEGFGLTDLHVVESNEPFRFAHSVPIGCDKWVALTKHKTFAACADLLHARGFRLYAAVPGAQMTLSDIDVSQPAALVFGNEHDGLSAEAQAACDATFSIPMTGFTQSFNLSVSVSLGVYETARRRRAFLAADGDLPEQERARLRAEWYALSMDRRAATGLVSRHVSGKTR